MAHLVKVSQPLLLFEDWYYTVRLTAIGMKCKHARRTASRHNTHRASRFSLDNAACSLCIGSSSSWRAIPEEAIVPSFRANRVDEPVEVGPELPGCG
jgi:hypothetical protein